MSAPPAALMAKAEVACASARALLDRGDTDGAANRAYYAMFDAARAALWSVGAPLAPDLGRTHSGLIGAFGVHLVKAGRVSKEVGRLLNRAHELRLVADYNSDVVDPQAANELVAEAELFIAAIKAALRPGG